MGAGIILTGGASLLQGSAELAEQIFDMPVKVGFPRGFNGLTDIVENPAYATVLGLILYKDQGLGGIEKYIGSNIGFISKLVKILKKWFGDFI